MNTIRNEDTIAVDRPDDPALRKLLVEQSISLKTNELERIRELFGRNPTLVELHIFNTMWSEHCSYKSSKTVLKEHLLTEAPQVVLGPGEDAGIIRFYEKDGKSYCLVLAHESHNHPSQVLPVEGAATGIGGIVRDVYCMGADVIGVMDPLRFGDPDGPNAKRARDIVRGVVDGIAQYGNALGVPNYGGDTYFHGSYDDNCLVNVVALGLVEESDIIRSRAPDAARTEAYDIILIGKPTDASGFGGAAFASERLSGDQAEERQEAVQVPDPFLKRVLAEASKVVLARAKKDGVQIGFKDLGAGGISCAISEMAQAGGVGAAIDLDEVPKFPESLTAAVVSCSETQERYAMFVPKHFTSYVCKVYNEDFELPHIYADASASVIGVTTEDKRFKLVHRGIVVCDADVDVITTGIEYDRASRQTPRTPAPPPQSKEPGVREALLELLGSYNIADKSILFQHYDSEVQGRAVIRPGEADAAVAVLLPGDKVGVAAGIGGNSGIGLVDPYLGGMGATDCLNFGDPEDPAVFWEFSEGVRGVGDACRALKVFEGEDHGVPVVSGNVSFYNQSGSGDPIAPTPIVACAGRVDDVSLAKGMGFKAAGSRIVLLGRLHDQLAGSEYAKHFEVDKDLGPPAPDFEYESAMIQCVVGGLEDSAVRAAHDISHGGLLVALTEMMLRSAPLNIGCSVELSPDSGADTPVQHLLFSEYGGIVVEVDPAKWPAFEERLTKRGVPYDGLGQTTEDAKMSVSASADRFQITFDEADAAHRVGGMCNKLFG
jgi:phosphoribosylformylglycinamidine synthase